MNRVPFSFSTDDGTGNFFLSAYAMSAQRIASDSEWKKTVGFGGLTWPEKKTFGLKFIFSAPRTNWPLQYGKYVLHERHSSATVPYARIFSTVPRKERAAIRQWVRQEGGAERRLRISIKFIFCFPFQEQLVWHEWDDLRLILCAHRPDLVRQLQRSSAHHLPGE